MVRAMLASDRAYEGLFYVGVKTTGIFCRPTCSARKPMEKNVEFYRTAEEAMASGFRPCLRCKPLDAVGAAPDWLVPVLKAVDERPGKRWTDEDVEAMGVDPLRVRRWFKENFGVTFHAHARSRRLARALGTVRQGGSLDDAAAEGGYESLSGFRDAIRQDLRTTAGRGRRARMLAYTRVLTPLGPMMAMAEERGLVMLEFLDRPALPAEVDELRARYGYVAAPGQNEHLQTVERELGAYFARELREFTVPVLMPGTTFQVRVWEALRRIPYGVTASYGELARGLGVAGAMRAVGRANGQNRMSIVVPCHRVIGADGSLTGYGGGQPRKAFLLELEGRPAEATQGRLFGEVTAKQS